MIQWRIQYYLSSGRTLIVDVIDGKGPQIRYCYTVYHMVLCPRVLNKFWSQWRIGEGEVCQILDGSFPLWG